MKAVGQLADPRAMFRVGYILGTAHTNKEMPQKY